ncbi:MAG TPA: dihydrodipicolinate synthase family protein [Terriglobia bacterium]|nr:dihydrodipicolinate synthase family protein [Terriglobia bacterium]
MGQNTLSLKGLAGVFSPTLTAFHADGSINPAGTKQFVRFLLDQGIDGLAPLGSGGEPVAMTLPERMRILEAIVEETAGKVPILAGTGDYSTAATIELSLHAKSLGCRGLMIITPYLMVPPKRDVLNHFRRVREKVGLPIMVYNVPFTTGIEITPEELKAWADEDVIHGVKWSHAEVNRIHNTRFLCGPDFPVFAGNDLIAFEGMAVGAQGWISGVPMMVPALAVKLHRLLTRESKLEAARELWYRILPLVRLEFGAAPSGDWNPHIISVVREAALLRRIPVGSSRLPLSPVDPAVREELRKILASLGEL